MRDLTHHIVQSCKWETSCDEKEYGFPVQQKISAWSNNQFPYLLQEILEEFFPVSETWRIERLDLDLGEIDFDHTEDVLQENFTKALRTALSNLFLSGGTSEIGFKRVESTGSAIDLLQIYLQSGCLPWWYKDSGVSIKSYLSDLLVQEPDRAFTILRSEGKKESARNRIVWQFGEDFVHQVIRVTEPSNAGFIIDYQHSLQQLNDNNKAFNTPSNTFKQQSWLWILEHLFVDRGSVFNSKEFIKYTIAKFARHYSMGYEDLLIMITEGVSQLKQKMLVKPAFFTALDILIAEEQVGESLVAPKNQVSRQDERFNVFASLIQNRQEYQNDYDLRELFSSLSTTDSVQLRRVLLSTKNTQTVIGQFLARFNRTELKKVVEIVLPDHHEVVYAFVTSTQNKLKKTSEFAHSHTVVEKIVWKVVFNFLLEDRGSVFNKRAFLKQTITNISTEVGVSYFTILSILAYLNNSDASHYVREQELGYLLNELVKVAELGAEHKKESVKKKQDLIQNYVHVGQSSTSFNRSNWNVQPLITEKGEKDPGYLIRLIKNASNKNQATKNILAKADLETLKRLVFYAVPGLQANYDNLIRLSKVENNLISKRLSNEYLEVAFKIAMADSKALGAKEFNTHVLSNLIARDHELGIFVNKVLSQANKLDLGIFAEELKRTIVQLSTNKPIRKQTKDLFQPSNEGYLEYLIKDEACVVELLSRVRESKSFRTWLMNQHDHSWKNQVVNHLLVRGQDEFDEFLMALKQLFYPDNISLIHEKWFTRALWGYLLKSENRNTKSIWLFLLKKTEERFGMTTTEIAEHVFSRSKDGYSISKGLKEVLRSMSNGAKRDSSIQQSSDQGFKEYLKKAIKNDTLEELIPSLDLTDVVIDQVVQVCSLDDLIIRISKGQSGTNRLAINTYIQAMLSERSLSDQSQLSKEFRNRLFRELLVRWESGKWLISDAIQFVAELIEKRLKNAQVSSESIQAEIVKFDPEVCHQLCERFQLSLPGVSPSSDGLLTDNQDDIEIAISYLLHGGSVVKFTDDTPLTEVWKRWVSRDPDGVANQLKPYLDNERVRTRVMSWMSFDVFSKVLKDAYPMYKEGVSLMSDLFLTLKAWGSQLAEIEDLEQLLYARLMRSWVFSTMNQLTASRLLQEVIWDVVKHTNHSVKEVEKQIFQQVSAFPKKIQPSLLVMRQQVSEKEAKKREQTQVEYPKLNNEPAVQFKVRNAGIVLVESYIKMLFDRLGLLDSNEFKTHKHQRKAAHCLQWLVTGLHQTDEHELVLNKILCGIHYSDPIEETFEISDDHQETMRGLIKSMISFWEDISSSSVQGFRGNWLVREGLLTESDDHWNLTIEKKAYDILMQRSPFSFSIIKYPWMLKPIHVTWPY